MVKTWKVKSLNIVLSDETISVSQGDDVVRLDKSELIGAFVTFQEIIAFFRKQKKENHESNENDRDTV